MRFFLLRVGSALLITIVAGLMMVGAFVLAPPPAHADVTAQGSADR